METRKRNFTDEHRKKLSKNNPKSKKIVCTLTNGEIVEFVSIRECERTFGVSRQTLLNWLKKGISKRGNETFESIELAAA